MTKVPSWQVLRPWLGVAARLTLGTVWIAAGATKVGDLAASGRAVAAYRLLPHGGATFLGAVLPFLEIALGLLLLAGLGTRLAAATSAILLVVFILGIVSAWARGLRIDCGCFGGGGELGAGEQPRYLSEILRDVGLLVVAGFLALFPRSRYSVDSWLLADTPVPTPARTAVRPGLATGLRTTSRTSARTASRTAPRTVSRTRRPK